MILLVSAVALIVVTVAFTFFLGGNPAPMTDTESPVKHLEERRAAIYENLRDLQFEFRVGKLSDADYQQTKLGLQRELAGVLAEIERVSGKAPAASTSAATQPSAAAEASAPAADSVFTCVHCGAQFSSPMKFCGECGQEMTGKESA